MNKKINKSTLIGNNTTETHNYINYVKTIITISQNTDDSELLTIKDFKRNQLRKLVPKTINDEKITKFIDLLFKRFLLNLKKYGIKMEFLSNVNDGIYLLLFNNIYVSTLRYIYNEWSIRKENSEYKTEYQTFAMILYIIMNLYNVQNFKKETQIEFELFYTKCNRLSREVDDLTKINLYETINKSRSSFRITSLKFDTHFKYISNYSIKDSLTIKLETIKKIFDILKTPYIYDVFDQYISTIKDNFEEFQEKIKSNLRQSGLIKEYPSEIHSTEYIGQIEGCKRFYFTPKQIAKIKALSPKCQSFLDVMMDGNEVLANLIKKEPEYYETLMNIYISVVDSLNYNNFKQKLDDIITKKTDRKRMINNIFKLVGLAAAASVPIIAPVAIPFLAGADILSMIGDTFNTDTVDLIGQEVVQTP